MELPSGMTVAKVGGAIAASLLAYRGLCLYLRNDVTVSITELVRLPPPATVAGGGSQRQVDPGAVTVKGTIEVETCLMRSYRFMLRLAGVVKNEVPTSVVATAYSMPSSPRPAGAFAAAAGGGGGSLSSSTGNALSRRRVMSSFSSRAFEGNDSSSPFAGAEEGAGGGERSLSKRLSGTSSHPTIFVESASDMVDVCEIDISGHVCFTPACVMDDTLLTYVAAPASALLLAGSASSSGRGRGGGGEAVGKGASSAILAAALTGGPDGCGNVSVRNCYLQADESARNGMKLSLEVEVANPIHGLQVLIRLPHRRCRFLHAQTGGVGVVRQPMKTKKPHRLVWDIGTVDSATRDEAHATQQRQKHASERTNRRRAAAAGEADEEDERDEKRGRAATTRVDVLEVLEDVSRKPTVQAGVQSSPSTSAAAAATVPAVDEEGDCAVARQLRDDLLSNPALGLRLLIARCTIVFEQPPDLFLDEGGDSSDSTDEDDRDDAADSPVEEDEIREEEMFASAGHRRGTPSPPSALPKRGVGSSVGGGGGGQVGLSPAAASRHQARSSGGAASAPNQSRKAARRQAKQRAKSEEKRRRREAAVLAGRGSRAPLPTVEVTYSTSGLASGTSVKKLQVLSDKANWVARSPLDRFVLQKVMLRLENMKLSRFAHYTTWFVQPVPVATLAM